MEEGSLLDEVLRRRGDGGVRCAGDGPTRSTLTVDVVPLDVPLQLAGLVSGSDSAGRAVGPHSHENERGGRTSPESQSLDRICAELNAFVDETTSGYPWFLRRPRFAPHTLADASDGPGSSSPPIKVLRAMVEYGLQVTDEWMMVHLMLTFTGANPALPVAVECWDDEDGQIVLIEAAHTLPDWVDSVDCRHRCWIQAGQVMLLSPTSVPGASVESALSKLRPNAASAISDEELLVNQRVTDAIRSSIRSRVTSVPHTHRALVYLPRSVVETMVTNHSHLVGEVVAAFVEHATSGPSSGRSPHREIFRRQPSALLWSTDWMWTTFAFGRTHYALLRQFSSPSWPVCDGIPSWFVSTISEIRQQENQPPSQLCAALDCLETYPSHLKHGLCVGVRLVLGLLSLCTDSGGSKVSDASADPKSNEWALLRAEMEMWRATNANDINGTSCSGDGAAFFPAACDVNDEDWMNVTEDEMKRLTKIVNPTEPAFTSGVESVIGGVRSFLSRESDAYGIDSQAEDGETENGETETSPTLLPLLEVDPVVVLNLLHAALKAPTAEDLVLPERPSDAPSEPDPFFSEHDYHDLMEKGSSDGDDDDSTSSSISDREGTGNGAYDEDAEMRKIMDAMDAELQRTMDVTDADLENVEDAETIESMHLLSNLLQSLESSSGPGAVGPLQSMLKEMGIQPLEL